MIATNRPLPAAPASLAVLVAVLLLAGPLASAAEAPAAPPASGTSGGATPVAPPPLTGIEADAAGSIFVTPAHPERPAVLAISEDGELLREWARPRPIPLEITDVDSAGRPMALDTATATVFVFDAAGGNGAPRMVELTTIEGLDPRSLAPFVRAAKDGTLVLPTVEGNAVVRIDAAGKATTLRLQGATAPVGDFDVADDGRMALLDPRGRRVRLYDAGGKPTAEVDLSKAGAADGIYARVRFVPGSGEFWVLELPAKEPVKGQPAAAVILFDDGGKKERRVERVGGTPLGPVAGIAAVKDGVWLGALDGVVQRLDRRGKSKARFDASPAPPGIAWSEKRRLEALARLPANADVGELIAALAVHRGKPLEAAIWEALTVAGKAAAPPMIEATARGTHDETALAIFFVKTRPATLDAMRGAFAHAAPKVRLAAVAALRDPAITGFDAELEAATRDADAEVRAGALVVAARGGDPKKVLPLFLARLDDENDEVSQFAVQMLGTRLPDVVGELAAIVKDGKAGKRKREMASRALLLEFPGGERLPDLEPGQRAPLRALAASTQVPVQRVGALALAVHGDDAAPAAIEKAWPQLTPEQKQLALTSWSPHTGDAGAKVLIALLGREKNEALRPLIYDGLAAHGTGAARAYLMKTATTPGGKAADRALALVRVQRRLSDAQIATIASELAKADPVLRGAILQVVAERGVEEAAPAVAALAKDGNEQLRREAFLALYRLGSAAGVAAAVARLEAGKADEVDLSYMAAVGGIPEGAKPRLREMAKATGPSAILAAEALARSGDATGVDRLVDRAKADQYGQGARDGSLIGAIAGLGDAGRAVASSLLKENNPATREDGALALAVLGGEEACREVRAWGGTPRVDGVSVPAAFFAVAACGDVEGAVKLYVRIAQSGRRDDPAFTTVEPRAFAALLAEMLRQPDFRTKAEPVLRAAGALPDPVRNAVAQFVGQDLHPDVAVPAMKHLF